MIPKLKQTLFTGLLSFFLTYLPFNCKDYSIRSISKLKKQEQTFSKEEQYFDLEEKLYQRKSGIRREINLKGIKLCKSITPGNQCQETSLVQRNQTAYLLANFDLIGLKDVPLAKEVGLNYEGKKVILSSEIESFPQEKELWTKVSVLFDEEKPLGYHTLGFTLKDQNSGLSASLTKEIELKEGLVIKELKLCEKIEQGECFNESKVFPEEKGKIYFLLKGISHQEGLEKLVLKGEYSLTDLDGNKISSQQFKYQKKGSGGTEEIALSGKIPLKAEYPLGEYKLEIKLENPKLNLITKKESGFTLTGLRIKDFKFCREEDSVGGECTTDSREYIIKSEQPFSVYHSYKIITNFSTEITINTQFECDQRILREYHEGPYHESFGGASSLLNIFGRQAIPPDVGECLQKVTIHGTEEDRSFTEKFLVNSFGYASFECEATSSKVCWGCSANGYFYNASNLSDKQQFKNGDYIKLSPGSYKAVIQKRECKTDTCRIRDVEDGLGVRLLWSVLGPSQNKCYYRTRDIPLEYTGCEFDIRSRKETEVKFLDDYCAININQIKK